MSVTESELHALAYEAENTDLADVIERQRLADDVPYPMPVQQRRRWQGRWSNTRAVDRMTYGHVRLGAARYPTRLEMVVALKALDQAHQVEPTPEEAP